VLTSSRIIPKPNDALMPSAARIVMEVSQACHVGGPCCWRTSASGSSKNWSSDARRKDTVPWDVAFAQGGNATSNTSVGMIARFFIALTIFVCGRLKTVDMEFGLERLLSR